MRPAAVNRAAVKRLICPMTIRFCRNPAMPPFRMEMAMNRQHKQKGRSHLGPALFARSQGPERDPAVSRETTVKSVSNLVVLITNNEKA